MAVILDGNRTSQKIKDALKKQVAQFKKKTGDVPTIVNIMIGNTHSACSYAKGQKQVAEYIGLHYQMKVLPKEVTQDELIELIKQLNRSEQVNGIMIHQPVPAHIQSQFVANYVESSKDLEGINVANIGKMMLGETNIIPCTPAAVMELIRETGVSMRGKETVVVGHSDIVGKPLSLLLLREYATVTVCHIATSESGHLREHVGRADILVVAVGKPFLIKGDWIKEGAIVIDVGINRIGSRIVGDIEFEEAKKKAAFISPVPGGVGPVTVVMLMKNCVEAFQEQNLLRMEQG